MNWRNQRKLTRAFIVGITMLTIALAITLGHRSGSANHRATPRPVVLVQQTCATVGPSTPAPC